MTTVSRGTSSSASIVGNVGSPNSAAMNANAAGEGSHTPRTSNMSVTQQPIWLRLSFRIQQSIGIRLDIPGTAGRSRGQHLDSPAPSDNRLMQIVARSVVANTAVKSPWPTVGFDDNKDCFPTMRWPRQRCCSSLDHAPRSMCQSEYFEFLFGGWCDLRPEHLTQFRHKVYVNRLCS